MQENQFLFNPFNNDVALGFRLNLNDFQSTEALVTITFDLEHSSKFLTVEASRRIGENWIVSIEGLGFFDIDRNDPFYTIRKDSMIQFGLSYYY